jgi:hypothetical protein
MFGKRNAYFIRFCIQITSKIVVTAISKLLFVSYVSVVYVHPMVKQ